MKKLISPVIWLALFQYPVSHKWEPREVNLPQPVHNLFIITLDGFRWQELFTGADSVILNDETYTPDTETMKLLYWADTPGERRKKLMPFIWNVMVAKGQLFGNRHFENKVNTVNGYSLSYPGYNEILTGNTGITITSNRKINNPNISVLEYLNNRIDYKGKVAAFTSWDAFPYILNTGRSGIMVNSGYSRLDNIQSGKMQVINTFQSEIVRDKQSTRDDMLTFLTAMEFTRCHHPRIVFLGLGETDEYAHDGRYDLYLQQASKADRIIAELWHWIQTTPGYRNNTSLLLTTDHGRGKRPAKWTSHGEWIRGSSQAWFALLGPGIAASGEIREPQQHYLAQLTRTIAGLLGEDFMANAAPPPVSFNAFAR